MPKFATVHVSVEGWVSVDWWTLRPGHRYRALTYWRPSNASLARLRRIYRRSPSHVAAFTCWSAERRMLYRKHMARLEGAAPVAASLDHLATSGRGGAQGANLV